VSQVSSNPINDIAIAQSTTGGRAPIAIMIPTKNEEANLPFALASVRDWAAQVFVLDSGSTDRTREITEQYGATIVHHDWAGYARQKNWGLDNLPITMPWVFILDADEVITPELRDELTRVAREDRCPENGFYVNRFFIFLDKRIRHCGFYPSWNLRFFRRGKARYEEREVHEHMVVDGRVGYLRHDMEHNDRRGLADYIAKHNRYSTLEAAEMFKTEQGVADGTFKARFWGGPIERRRWIKHKLWPRLPARWLARFMFMYVFRLGFLDGATGFHFCLFMAAYEHQISLKLKELRTRERRARKSTEPH
jgi:glycosyltransferase involved in cell wall biosynthesis